MWKRMITFFVMLALVAIAMPAFALTFHQRHAVVGEIASVDTSANTVAVKVKNETERFSLDANAEIVSNGKTLKLADLTSGERVEVTYTDQHKNRMASRITVLTSSHAS